MCLHFVGKEVALVADCGLDIVVLCTFLLCLLCLRPLRFVLKLYSVAFHPLLVMDHGGGQLARGLVLVLATVAHRALHIAQEKVHLVPTEGVPVPCICQCAVEAGNQTCVVAHDPVVLLICTGLGLAVGLLGGLLGCWCVQRRVQDSSGQATDGDAQLAFVRSRVRRWS